MGNSQTPSLQTVYKVVSVRQYMYRSASVTDPNWSLLYDINMTTRPKYDTDTTTRPHKGYIFAFSTLESARRWAEQNFYPSDGKYAILESDAVIADDAPYKMSLFLLGYCLTEFWREGEDSNLHIPPHGTVWCSELTPRRVVKLEDDCGRDTDSL